MKFRLEAEHYVDNLLIPAGSIVGDGGVHSWRHPADDPNVALRGTVRAPSAAMIPLDAEAKDLFNKRFPAETPPDRDPTSAIPLGGPKRDAAGNVITVGQPAAAPESPTEKSPTGVDVTKDDSLAKEDPALNKGTAAGNAAGAKK